MQISMGVIGRKRAKGLLDSIAASNDPVAVERAVADLKGINPHLLGFDLIEEITALDDAEEISRLLGLTGEERVNVPTDVADLRVAGLGSEVTTNFRLARKAIEQVLEGLNPVGLAYLMAGGGKDVSLFYQHELS